jgi:hypothetical protein
MLINFQIPTAQGSVVQAADIERDVTARLGLTEGGSCVTWVGARGYLLAEPVSEMWLAKHAGNRSKATIAIDQLGAQSASWVSSHDAAKWLIAPRAATKAGLLRGISNPITLPSGSTAINGWHLDACRVRQAWGMLPATPGALPWRDIKVAQLDTGYTAHPALGFDDNGTSVTLDLQASRTFFGAATALPNNGADTGSGAFPGHGTRIASAIAGYYQNATTGTHFYGVTPGVKLVMLRVTDSVIIDHVTQHMANAIRYAVDEAKVDVINISLGGIAWHADLDNALRHAYSMGVIVNSAAGQVIRDVVFPGRHPAVVTLAGVCRAQTPARFVPWSSSARGPTVDVCGPAHDVIRANARLSGGAWKYDFADGDGTSYATAMATGLAVLWLTYHRTKLAAQYSQPWQRIEAFRACLYGSVFRPAGWDDGNFGKGVYQADELLKQPLPQPSALASAI